MLNYGNRDVLLIKCKTAIEELHIDVLLIYANCQLGIKRINIKRNEITWRYKYWKC